MGGIVNAVGSVFGSSNHQDTSSNQQSRTDFQQQDVNAIRKQQAALTPLLQQLASQGQTYGNQAQGFNTNLNTNFGPGVNLVAPGSGGLDQTAQRLISQQMGQQQAQLASQQRQIGQQFQGSNPGVARILQQQAMSQSRLQQNPLAFAANQEMAQRQQLANQAALQQSQNNSGLQQMGNQAQLQQQGSDLQRLQSAFGLKQAGVGAQQNLLSTLLSLGQAFGTNVSQGGQQSSGKSGGIF